MQLKIVVGSYSIARYPISASVDSKLWNSRLVSITKTPAELSIVAESRYLDDPAANVNHHWSLLEVLGPLDFSLTGVLSRLTSPLSAANISIFAISTYDTDYLLVKESKLKLSIKVLEQNGFDFV